MKPYADECANVVASLLEMSSLITNMLIAYRGGRDVEQWYSQITAKCRVLQGEGNVFCVRMDDIVTDGE